MMTLTMTVQLGYMIACDALAGVFDVAPALGNEPHWVCPGRHARQSSPRGLLIGLDLAGMTMDCGGMPLERILAQFDNLAPLFIPIAFTGIRQTAGTVFNHDATGSMERSRVLHYD